MSLHSFTCQNDSGECRRCSATIRIHEAVSVHNTPTTTTNRLTMGRLATNVAAAAVDADNLPEKLPNISLLDALLPKPSKQKKNKARRAV